MKLFNIVVGVVVAVGLMGAARADGIVLESYTGDRPADAARLLAPFFEELSKRKVDAGDGVARTFDSQVSRPARTADGVPSDFEAQVDKGFKEWVGGNFDKAIKILVPLIDNAHANSGLFVGNKPLRKALQKALIGLAIAQARIGDQAAMSATMKELIRSFPDAVISKGLYGPEAANAFAAVTKEVAGQGKGKLTVTVSNKSAVVAINEDIQTGTLETSPGEYRVVASIDGQPLRTHVVTVKANETTTLAIDVAFDAAVRTTGYTGFSYGTDGDRVATEALHAITFARSIRADSVAVVGIEDVRGRPSLFGALVSLQDGRDIRRASIPLEPAPSNKQVASLAPFLFTGEGAAPGLVVETARKAPEPPTSSGGTIGTGGARVDRPEPVATTSNRWGGWRFLTGFLGVGGLVAGGILVALDGNCSMDPPQGQPCNDLYATATPGYVALGAGAVFTGISIYLFATHKTVPVVQTAQGGSGGTVGFMTRW